MPELPNVESFRRYLDATALNKTVSQVQCLDEKVLGNCSPQSLGSALSHRRMTSTRRWGKYLFAELDNGRWLDVHFGMTGFLRYYKGAPDGREAAFDAVRLLFTNHYTLALNARRKLACVRLVDDPEKSVEKRGLGPDALAVEEHEFLSLIRSRRGMVKPFLMNQSVMAGIGNEYSDEILFQARLHPAMHTDSLSNKAQGRLYRTMRAILSQAIECGAEPERMPSTFLTPRRGDGSSCPRCSAPLSKIKVAGRFAVVCEQCQPPP